MESKEISKKSYLQRTQSVSRRFSYALIGIVALVLMLYAVTTLYFDNIRINTLLDQKLSGALELSKVSLPTPLWNLDNHIVDDYLDALFLEESIVYAEVVWGSKVISRKVRERFEENIEKLLRTSSLFISKSSDVLYEGNKVGTVRISVSRETLKKEFLLQILRTAGLIILIILAVAATSLAVTKKYITSPLLSLQESTYSIAKGNLDTFIDTSSRDEIGILAQNFDEMRISLKALFTEVNENKSKIEKYSRTLEHEVEKRTQELAQSVEELQALAEVSRIVGSTLNFEDVLANIVRQAVQLSEAEGGAIFEFDGEQQVFVPRSTHGVSEQFIRRMRQSRIHIGNGTAVGQAGLQKAPVHIPELEDARGYPLSYVIEDGFRALLAVPFLRETRLVGGLTVLRKTPGEFPERTVQLLQAFASQSVLAINNAQLYRELEDKSRQLKIADKHKSEFLANMSHELRTPLNAILGYTELILDSIYGEVPGKIKEVLVRLEKNGRHLLNLINDVLDISKIEAGQFTLSLDEYSLGDLVQTVLVSVEALANEKKLQLLSEVAPDLPRGKADSQRIAQVLVNLVGNAVKFTEEGLVRVTADIVNNSFHISVSDTGSGLQQKDREIIFKEFRQVDGSSTKKKGGTGLGLSIAKKIVEMHGGSIWVDSNPGEGATFTFTIPVRVEKQMELR